MTDNYAEKLAYLRGVFTMEPRKAEALFEVLNAITDRVRAIEEENAKLRAAVVKLGCDLDSVI